MGQVVASVLRLVRLVFARFGEDRCVQVAGSLTFTTLLALVPLVAIALTLIAAFPVFEDWANEIKIFILLNFVPEAGGKIITGYMQQFADNATRLTAIGIVFLFVTALMLVVTIERVFNVLWRVQRPRPMVRRLLIYWGALTIGPLLIGASLSLTSWVVGQSLGVAKQVPGADSVLLRLVPWALNTVAFGFLYLALPNRRVSAKDALLGGVAAAVAFELMKRGFGLYVTTVPAYAAVYGTFATIPIFLLWVFLSWVVVLFGAVVVAVLPAWRAGSDVTDAVPGRRFYRAVRVLRALYLAHRDGRQSRTASLARGSRLSEDDTDDILLRLEENGWAARIAGGGWVLARDLATLPVIEVYRTFAFGAPPEPTGDAAMDADLEKLSALIERPLAEPLARPIANCLGAMDQPRACESSAPAARPD